MYNKIVRQDLSKHEAHVLMIWFAIYSAIKQGAPCS